MGLLIADDVYQRKMATMIPSGSGCYSSCALIFLAGDERQADGELGVHQITSDNRDLVSAQLSISDILDVLNRFDTPVEVLTVMFRTPPDDMHVFSDEEIARYEINRRHGDTASQRAEPLASMEPFSDEMSTREENAATGDPDNRSAPDLGRSSAAKLSAIEDYARRPTRMAVYAGLDFYGGDTGSQRVNDAPSCARACLALNGECKAFTYNANERILSGPNCFLKSNKGVVDANMFAISGELLTSNDRDPGSFTMGVIDPKAGIFDKVDLPGGDLSQRPERSAKSMQQCRLSCVKNDRCIAFTFVRGRNECWLKGSASEPNFRDGMVSGVKKLETFEPATIVELD
ncbi:hypothetical protein H9Q09_04925 [Aurantimonas sp. DM33-3]|nr:hypothetical protein [Aurantimonas sp. DM33-3]